MQQHSTTVIMPSVDEDAWYVLLSFGQLSSDSFIRLSWVSGQLRRLCKQIAADKSAAQALLLQAISAASAQLEPVNAPAAFESNNAAIPNLCFEQKLAWLKKQAPKFLQDGRVMAAALQQHNMPRPVATALLRHGAQFTWQQLQDAARRLVPGLQVWVELSRELQLPLHASVPHIAAAICCEEELGLQCVVLPPVTLNLRNISVSAKTAGHVVRMSTHTCMRIIDGMLAHTTATAKSLSKRCTCCCWMHSDCCANDDAEPAAVGLACGCFTCCPQQPPFGAAARFGTAGSRPAQGRRRYCCAAEPV